jgi:hypothetical protein
MTEEDDVQYIQLEGSAFDEAKEFIEKIGETKLNIMFIEKVISKKQTENYEACPIGNERYLFHGTNPDKCTSIETGGLQVKYSVNKSYGPGNYFSPCPLVSFGYAIFKYDYKPIYLCKVKLGEYGVNHGGNKTYIYRTSVDNQSNIIYRIGLFNTGQGKSKYY